MPLEELPIEDRWILSRLATTTAAVTEQLGLPLQRRGADDLRFTWSEFCDWYVEMSKGRLRDAGEPAAGPARAGRACSTRSCGWCIRSCRSWPSRSGRR